MEARATTAVEQHHDPLTMNRMQPIGGCPLCRSSSVPLVNSHIIPKWAYGPAMSEDPKGKHRAIKFHVNSSAKDQIVQDGVKEYLLCSRCDNEKIGDSIEGVFIDAWNKEDFTNLTVNKMIDLKYVSPESFLLFGLSILWRAHHATSEGFQDVDLGKFENRIRDMIWNCRLEVPLPFLCEAHLLVDPSMGFQSGSVTGIFCGKKGSATGLYHNAMFGAEWHWHVSNRPKRDLIANPVIAGRPITLFVMDARKSASLGMIAAERERPIEIPRSMKP